jgi:hypothetical protein
LPVGAYITAIKFRKTVINSSIKQMSHKIYMANSTRSALAADTWASIMASHSLVYSNATLQVPLDSGWVTWTVTPFAYTGGALEMATEQQMDGNGGANSYFSWRVDGTVPVNLIEGQTGVGEFPDTLNGTNANYLHRPNTRFVYTMSLLPVQLLGFTAKRMSSGVVLDWNVTKEENLLAYQVERSANGASFEQVSSVKASQQAIYSLTDSRVPLSKLYYRLKLLEKDGSYSYSKTVPVDAVATLYNVTLVGNNQLQVNMQRAGKLQWQLLTVDGRVVKHAEQLLPSGSSVIILPVAALAKGMYMVRTNFNDQCITLPLVR